MVKLQKSYSCIVKIDSTLVNLSPSKYCKQSILFVHSNVKKMSRKRDATPFVVSRNKTDINGSNCNTSKRLDLAIIYNSWFYRIGSRGGMGKKLQQVCYLISSVSCFSLQIFYKSFFWITRELSFQKMKTNWKSVRGCKSGLKDSYF